MLLLMAEFAYNNAMNTTTGVSPFFTNKGYHPEFTVDLQVETSSAKAEVFMVDLECIQVELKENIAQAQEVHGGLGMHPGGVEGEHCTGSGKVSEECRQAQGRCPQAEYQ